MNASSLHRNLFFRRWLKNPRSVGSLIPSSQKLARLIAESTVTENAQALAAGESILELGAGTGAFTQALLKAGVPRKQLVSVELDPQMYAYLKRRFEGVTLLCGDASKLDTLLEPHPSRRFAAVISGIPMVNLPFSVKEKIVQQVFKLLGSTKALYQFTYTHISCLPEKKLGLQKRRVGFAFRNFPPATIWAYTKKHSA